MEHSSDKNFIKELLAVCFIGAILFVLILVGTGSVFSGYHLVDDHVTMNIFYEIQGKNPKQFIMLMLDALKEDFKIRFRPNYFIELYLLTALLGIDFNLWMVACAIEGIVSFALLYFLGRSLDRGRLISLFFAGIVIFGPQFTPWYRPPNQENGGVLFLTITMLLLTFLVKNERSEKDILSGRLYRLICIFMGMITAFQKEAFLILLPALLLFIAYLSVNVNKTPLKEAVIRYMDLIISYMLIFFAGIAFIVFYCGTNSIDYAGIDTKMTVGRILWNTASIIAHCHINYVAAAGMLILLYKWIKGRESVIKHITDDYFIWLFVVYSAGMEIILHIKSGMYERYYHPYVIIIALFIIIFIMKELPESPIIYGFYYTIIALLFITGFIKSCYMASEWCKWGYEASEFLNTVSDELYSNEKAQIFSELPGGGEISGSVNTWEKQYHKDYTFTYHAELTQDKISSGEYDIILAGVEALNRFDFNGFRIETTGEYITAVRE